jgi:hypothetical protein
MLSQIIYSSNATQSMDSNELERILNDARIGNEARNVTGALVYGGGVFLQVLEGERVVLDELVANIRNDGRHGAMKVFHDAEISQRAFSEWRMAYLSSDIEDMARWAGLEGTESIDELLDQVHRDKQRVPRILVSIVNAIAAKSKR